MARTIDRIVARWQDRAAVRAEHTLESTLHRRLDRAPQRWADRRATRTERRARRRDPAAIDSAVSRATGLSRPAKF